MLMILQIAVIKILIHRSSALWITLPKNTMKILHLLNV